MGSLCLCRIPTISDCRMSKRTLVVKHPLNENGTWQYKTEKEYVVRTGVADISVSFSVSPKWLKLLTAYSKMPKIAVKYFDTETLELKDAEMYITGFKAALKKDTSYKGLWTVSFTLKEM